MAQYKGRKKIGEILVTMGRVSEMAIHNILEEQQKTKAEKGYQIRLGDLLLKKKLICEEDLAEAVAIQYNTDYQDLRGSRIGPELLEKVPLKLLAEYNFVPLVLEKKRLTIASEDDIPEELFAKLFALFRVEVKFVSATRSQISAAKKACIERIGQIQSSGTRTELDLALVLGAAPAGAKKGLTGEDAAPPPAPARPLPDRPLAAAPAAAPAPMAAAAAQASFSPNGGDELEFVTDDSQVGPGGGLSAPSPAFGSGPKPGMDTGQTFPTEAKGPRRAGGANLESAGLKFETEDPLGSFGKKAPIAVPPSVPPPPPDPPRVPPAARRVEPLEEHPTRPPPGPWAGLQPPVPPPAPLEPVIEPPSPRPRPASAPPGPGLSAPAPPARQATPIMTSPGPGEPLKRPAPLSQEPPRNPIAPPAMQSRPPAAPPSRPPSSPAGSASPPADGGRSVPGRIPGSLKETLQLALAQSLAAVAYLPTGGGAQAMGRGAGGERLLKALDQPAYEALVAYLAGALGFDPRGVEQPVRKNIQAPVGPADESVKCLVTVTPTRPPLIQIVLSADPARRGLKGVGYPPGAPDVRAVLSSGRGLLLVAGKDPGQSRPLYEAALAEASAAELGGLALEEMPGEALPGVVRTGIVNPPQGPSPAFSATALASCVEAGLRLLAVDREPAQDEDLKRLVHVALTETAVLLPTQGEDALAAFMRVKRCGVSTSALVEATRLILVGHPVDRICPYCKETFLITEEMLPDPKPAGLVNVKAYRGLGCGACAKTGVQGKTFLFETLELPPGRVDVDRLTAEKKPLRNFLLEQGLLVPVKTHARRALMWGLVGLEGYLQTCRT